TGEILFEGEPVRVKGTGEAIQLQLYQDGYDLDASIPLYVKQDGKFEALLFDGAYKLVTRDKNGPWENTRDTLFVSVNGNTHVQVEVTPYFTISDETIELTETNLTGSFNVNKILDEAEVDYVMLLLNS